MTKIKRIHFQNFDWIDIIDPTRYDMEELQENYNFHILDIKECLHFSKRSKVDIYSDYAFLILHFPIYNRSNRQIASGQIKFFISKNILVTVHNQEFPTLHELRKLFEVASDIRKKFNQGSPEKLMYEILNRLFMYCFPMIDHLIEDCDAIDNKIFSGKESGLISEILLIRRNITDFRKIMQVHKNITKKISGYFKESPLFVMKPQDNYFEILVDYSKEIWDTLENLKERIEALQDSNESQISFKLSNIMKTLTIISVFTFPLTLFATIFSINPPGMPFIHSPYGFWIVIMLMGIILLSMAIIFKRKRWF